MIAPADRKSGADFSALSAAASGGIIPDQLRLAQAYLEGKGLPRNAEKAASWYIIAGENGSLKAKQRSIEVTRGMASFEIGQIRFDVAKMFMNGIGTRRDNVAAYTWFELAKAAGEVRAEGEEEILNTRMRPAQVEEAKRRASTWLQSHARKLPARGKQ
jgi:TPR repeat protein